MIFITLGTQKFQFNRLIKHIDELVEKGLIKDEVFAQIGYCDYEPKNYKYDKFLKKNIFEEYMQKSDLIITHGGVGSIISAIKKDKKVMAVPRLAEFKEHVDNHQLEIVRKFSQLNYIVGIFDMQDIDNNLDKINEMKFDKYVTKNEDIINSIEEYILSFN